MITTMIPAEVILKMLRPAKKVSILRPRLILGDGRFGTIATLTKLIKTMGKII